jgi:hypothetical protein
METEMSSRTFRILVALEQFVVPATTRQGRPFFDLLLICLLFSDLPFASPSEEIGVDVDFFYMVRSQIPCSFKLKAKIYGDLKFRRCFFFVNGAFSTQIQ